LGILDFLLLPFIIIFTPLQIVVDLLVCLGDAVTAGKCSFQLGVIIQLLVQATVQPILFLPHSVELLLHKLESSLEGGVIDL